MGAALILLRHKTTSFDKVSKDVESIGYTVDTIVLFPKQEWSLSHWYLNGFPKEKLYVGVPTYGRQFALSNPNLKGVGAPFSGGSLKTYREVSAGSQIQIVC